MTNYLLDIGTLRQRQSLPLEAKVLYAERRIREWYEHWGGDVYVAFSGGKDSTVLLDLVRGMYPEVPAVFSNTGLEYPEIVRFVRTVDNVTFVRPKRTFRYIVERWGYPFPSKEQAQYIHEYRHGSPHMRAKRAPRDGPGYGRIAKRWFFLTEAPFEVHSYCCSVVKKNPSKIYERATGRKPFLGTMAADSQMRERQYRTAGCNPFDARRPTSTPLGIWTTEDVWAYIRTRGLPYSAIYDLGYESTGCAYCGFGVVREDRPNRFERLRETHPKMYRYCMDRIGMRDVLEYVGIPH